MLIDTIVLTGDTHLSQQFKQHVVSSSLPRLLFTADHHHTNLVTPYSVHHPPSIPCPRLPDTYQAQYPPANTVQDTPPISQA